jgi:hypothetical protein
MGKERRQVQEFVAGQIAPDLIAAQVTDKDIADGEIPVAADRVVMTEPPASAGLVPAVRRLAG